MDKVGRILLVGLISGLVLNYYFKFIEWLTGDKVYTLLLNVDYIPVLKNYTFPEWIEISFHMIVSFVLAFIYAWLWNRWKKPFLYTVLTALVIGMVIYPTTGFSDRTPEVTDLSALFWWQTGHLLYGWVVAWMLQRLYNKTGG
ncbi:hypothetical protein CQS04_11550 [Chryseomicrobium excrementi]|uniref:DUF1440 domain-containing protein n=1 Tax=Chryseomicrobium excrementi TaxID=2041346 RepID=A0A2M9EXD6_9BACL|nr:hypothetical protein [Chryseomicrobium excrementi]PJK15865.1 hypothetical protein CQS04_11550 [Chryseomicrobium excrementi]